ncbi:MAG TPA: hypothetical protein VLH16_06060 [Bacteroidales bacterium]|nr:hypothetical protein [Bacteroidales bacterium]
MDVLILLLILLLVYATFRYLLPIFLRYWLLRVYRRNSVEKNNFKTKNTKPPGTVQIDYIPPSKKNKTAKDSGEFVEFEDIR